MGFKNPFRERLAIDSARQHFEDHELVLSPAHIAVREAKAEARLHKQGVKNPSRQQVRGARRELEEEMFQEWYELKKARGFANFSIDVGFTSEDIALEW